MEYYQNFLCQSNHSHDCIMVKDQHAKALDFMVNMKFSDSCIGFAAEKSNATVLHNFSMKISHQVMPRILYQHFICSSIEWHQR